MNVIRSANFNREPVSKELSEVKDQVLELLNSEILKMSKANFTELKTQVISILDQSGNVKICNLLKRTRPTDLKTIYLSQIDVNEVDWNRTPKNIHHFNWKELIPSHPLIDHANIILPEHYNRFILNVTKRPVHKLKTSTITFPSLPPIENIGIKNLLLGRYDISSGDNSILLTSEQFAEKIKSGHCYIGTLVEINLSGSKELVRLLYLQRVFIMIVEQIIAKPSFSQPQQLIKIKLAEWEDGTGVFKTQSVVCGIIFYMNNGHLISEEEGPIFEVWALASVSETKVSLAELQKLFGQECKYLKYYFT